MVSSTLNPKAIIKEKTITPDSFSNFMVGNSISSSSPVTEAANKIVSFSSPNVSSLPSNISNLLTNISTNILNQVDNSIKSTTNLLNSDYEIKHNKLKLELNTKLLNLEGRILPIETKVSDLDNRINSIQTSINEFNRDVETQLGTQSNEIVVLKNQVDSDKNNYQNIQQTSPVTDIQNVIIEIRDQAQNVLLNTLRNFTQDYQEKVKGFDDRRPNEVLTKFTTLYQNAIGFVNFFGNRANIEVVSKNLKALRNMFEESFEVAKVLRQTIVKIVKQLSNLPSASPSSGGLNLDVNVPGGRLKQAGGPSVRNVARGGRMGGILGGGLGLLGLGGMATALTGMSKAQEYQESKLSSGVRPAVGDQYLPENIISAFSQIVDRFTNAINDLIGGAKSSPGGSGGQGATSSKSGGGGGAGGGGGSSSGGVTITDDKQGLAELGLTQDEWNVYKQGIADVEVSGRPNGGYGIMGGSGGRFAGRYQMGDEAITEAAKVLGIPKPTRQEFLADPQLQEKMYLGYTISNFRYMKSLSPEFRAMTKEQQLATLPMAQLGIGNLSDQLRTGKISRDAWETPTTKFTAAIEKRRIEAGLKPFGQNLNASTPETSPKTTSNTSTLSLATKPTPPKVEPAPTKSQSTQARAQAISQPAQKAPTTVSLPPTIIDASPPQQSQGGSSGGVIPPPAPSGGGSVEVPMLPTTNPDNFLTMYSRIVYNIVDG